MIKPFKSAGTESVVLPITAHAIKRQAKRAKNELEQFLAEPPKQVTLSYAQEFVARIWGQDTWHGLRLSDSALTATPVASTSRASEGEFLHRIGPARAGALLISLLDSPAGDQWARTTSHLCELLVELESARARLTGLDEFKAILQRDGVDDEWGRSFPCARAFSGESLQALLSLESLCLFTHVLSRLVDHPSFSEMVAVWQRLEFFLSGIAGYNLRRGRKQPDDAHTHFGYVAGPVRLALIRIRDVLNCNAVLYDPDWSAAIPSWPMLRESWLGHASKDTVDWEELLRASRGGKAVFDLVSAMERVSYGGQSRTSEILMAWIRRPQLVRVMELDLREHVRMVKQQSLAL